MHFVALEIQKIWEHGRQSPRAYGPRLVVAETEMRADARVAADGLDRPVEDVNKAFRVLAVRVTTHGWFIHAEFPATCGHQVLEFLTHNGQECFGQRPTVLVLLVRQQPAAQSVRARDAGFQRNSLASALGLSREETLKPFKFLNGAEAIRRAQLADHLVF